MILKKLDDISLLKCRRVCKAWKAESSKILKTKPVWIKRKWDSEAFRNLYDCMQNSSDFPFCGLDLTVCFKSYWTSCYFQRASELFSRFGSNFTHLRSTCSTKMNAKLTEVFLSKASSTVQYLELRRACKEIQAPGLTLPSLRTLNFCHLDGSDEDEELLTQIIGGACILQEIQYVNTKSDAVMAAIRRCNRLSCVSSLIISSETPSQIFRELVMNPPSLLGLDLQNDGVHQEGNSFCAECLETVEALLQTSQLSLKWLKVYVFPQELKLKGDYVFPKLEMLDLTLEDQGSVVFDGVSRNMFPRLRKVRLDSRRFGLFREEIESIFCHQECYEPWETVETLELHHYTDRNTMRFIGPIFPRVSYVVVNYEHWKNGGWSEGPDDTQHEVWMLSIFPELTRLHILNLPYKVCFMDSFLTGIPLNMASRLRERAKQEIESGIMEIFRARRSIVELKSNNILLVYTFSSKLI